MFLTGCTGEPPKSNVNVNANQPANKPGNSNSDLTTTKTPTEATTNDAPTLKPTFKAYCDAMTKKDEAALRKVYSAATLKIFDADAKADKQTLMEYLSADRVSNKLCEIRNERIEGDVGVAEVKTEGSPNGIKLKFIKENGDWKLTNEFPDFEKFKNPASNSNAAK
jgi:hypothetical protein